MCKCVHFTPFWIENMKIVTFWVSRLQFLSIVFFQLQALVVNILCFADRRSIAPKGKVSSSLMLGVVSFLLAAEKGITASKLTFIIWPGGPNEWFLINAKASLRKTWHCWFMICDTCFHDKRFFTITREENKKKKSCLQKPGDELNKTNLKLLINCGSDLPHLFRNSRNADVIRRHIHSKKIIIRRHTFKWKSQNLELNEISKSSQSIVLLLGPVKVFEKVLLN